MSTPTGSAAGADSTNGLDTTGDTSGNVSDPAASCETGSTYNGSLGLRVGAIFIILVTSIFGALFPVLARRVKGLRVPLAVFDFAKYFGSGVIIATAFIHLLSPAFEELSSPCLTGTWQLYPWPAAIAMFAIFCLFFVEFYAIRIGMAKLEALGVEYNAHEMAGEEGGDGHHHVGQDAPLVSTSSRNMDETSRVENGKLTPFNDEATVHHTGPKHLISVVGEKGEAASADEAAMESQLAMANPAAQILGVAILEFGVIFHSVTIGLTLAVTADFTTLFIVIIFHQMFEGLGLGSRLAYLPLPTRLNWVPIVGALAYAFVTPLGLAIGLGVRTTYNDNSANANIIQGVLDSVSAGILLYTGLVELLAHEFLFHDRLRKAPLAKVLYAQGCMVLGAGIMALLGRWA